MNRLKVWLSAILLCVATSCASVQQYDTQNTTPSSIEVDNENWADAIVYIVQGTMKYRLGDVTSISTRRFAFPRGMFDHTLHFQVHLMAGFTDWVSDDFEVNGSAKVMLTVGEPINYSHVEVYLK